ncbi:choice-of-anchor Q domain-containing protein [Wenzhouxiangella marina]|uniref:DUF11 domain-containing protein n=1 Tax=Wenzhouxiangella marina TaxID=1579979 RepID=A0A0K0XU45_9GAMM|nr:choice-of-anchor Q domain-containing protein [Wenzhouxiangella marina]AKS41214.1 hypothetical protein WM2015_833 [Wenzhouxiangella marina]MBB6088094.1 hypothetical protein [Wenzhouxiangella marina]
MIQHRLLICLFSLNLLMPTITRAAIIDIGPNGCSLADAIRSANLDSAIGQCSAGAGTDQIVAPDGWEITLSSELPTIESDLTLRTQTAAGHLRISGDFSVPILKIHGSGTAVNIHRVEFFGGKRDGVGNPGGAALSIRDATVSIVDSEFRANTASLSDGGAINIRDGVLLMTRTVISNNWTRRTGLTPKRGGGIYAEDSVLDLEEVFFDQNFSLLFNPEEAGTTLSDGLFMNGGSLVLRKSEVYESYYGIRAINAADVLIENTTFEDAESGYVDIPKLEYEGPGVLVLNHVTMSAEMRVVNAILEASNSIFAQCVTTGTTWTVDTANKYFNFDCNGPRDWPGVIALADNGGFTRTRASTLNSSVVDAGDPAYCLAEDQRGEPRGAQCDIGAYELTSFADVGVSLVIEPAGPWVDGQAVRAMVEVSNAGPGNANAVSLSAATQQFFVQGVDASFCSSLPCLINQIPAGETVRVPIDAVLGSFQSAGFDVDVAASRTGASYYQDPDESDPGGNNRASASGAIDPGADLSLQLDLLTPPPYFVGQTVVYRAVIANGGGQAASPVELELFPAGGTIEAFAGCSSVNGPLCTLGQLNDGQTAQIDLDFKVNAAAFVLDGEVSAPQLDIAPADNLDDQGNQGAVSEADVSVELELAQSAPYYSDQFLVFTARIRTGNAPASNVRFWSEMPGAVGGFFDAPFCTGGSPCVIPSMAANEELVATIAVFAPVAPDDGSVPSWAHRIYAEPGQVDSNPANNEAIIQQNYQAATNLVVDVELLSQPPFAAGDVVDYEIELINGGVNRARDVVLTVDADNLELEFLSGNQCQAVDCELATMDFAQRERILLQYRVVDPGDFNLGASITGADYDPALSNNSDPLNGATAVAPLTDSLFSDRFRP